ncbi:Uma2 family endonuclease [Pantanalinema rosaneae CENA516]|uniref:Uma2 family endonuclease n=1 Tax=Pantanalinema rosaneae TaxID=1620701 RepID=UPI003D6F7C8A
MVQAQTKPLTFEEFLEQYPENGGCYELVEGEVIEVRPIGKHELISGFLSYQLTDVALQANLPYRIPKTCVVKPNRPGAGYIPDVVVLDLTYLNTDPLWETASTITQGTSAQLVVEVVSTNWRDDYGLKLSDYEALGIPEYWIIDYKALGAERNIGSPKQPTLTICTLVNGEYHLNQYREDQSLISTVFPNLELTANMVFNAGLLPD